MEVAKNENTAQLEKILFEATEEFENNLESINSDINSPWMNSWCA